MGDDLRKYMPRISTILRETDPEKMEERHRKALEDPELQQAIAEMRGEIEASDAGRRTPTAPARIDTKPANKATPPIANTAAEERPVTKPATVAGDPELAQRRRKLLVGIAAVFAVAVPTTLGIVLATRYAGRGPAPAESVTAPRPSASTAPSAPRLAPLASASAVAPSTTNTSAAVVPTSTANAARSAASSGASPVLSAPKKRAPDDPYADAPAKRDAGHSKPLPPEDF